MTDIKVRNPVLGDIELERVESGQGGWSYRIVSIDAEPAPKKAACAIGIGSP